MPKTLHHKGSGKLILRMTDRQHADLLRLLVEESTQDRDYYIDDAVIDHLRMGGCDVILLKALRGALDERRSPYRDPATPEPAVRQPPQEGEGIDVEWRDGEEDA